MTLKEKMKMMMMNKQIECPKCHHDYISQTTYLDNGFNWFTCYNCNYKSNNAKEFIK